jgi:uncharacterized cupin superfamily protein
MAAAARGLRALLGLPAARLLVAYGQSVVRDPRPLLQDLLFEHDPEAYLLRAEESRWCTDPSPGPRFGARRAEYTRLLGLTVLDFELVELPPGRQNYPLHGHDGKEELFLVTEGRGEALTERGGTARRTAIGPGDVLAFPPRFQVAHAIVNTGTAPLRFYVFGVPAEALDMVDFPESHVRGEYTPFGKRYRFRLPAERDLPYWDGVRTT